MGNLVDTVIEEARWEGFGLDALAERAGRAALVGLGLVPEGFALSVMGCDDARIAGLNADFRGKPAPTNVLSWPSEERGAEVIGGAPDLPRSRSGRGPRVFWAISPSPGKPARARPRRKARPMADHVTHLLVHAVLHLLGYDHVEEPDAALMEALEVRILASLGVSDPY